MGNEFFPLAVISDIHGNIWALEVVLEDIYRRNIRNVINLGDSVYGPLEPSRTADILIRENISSVSGNEDTIIHKYNNTRKINPTLEYVAADLEESHMNWLKDLPFKMDLPGQITCFHGTPLSETEYLIHEVKDSIMVKRREERILDILKPYNYKYFLCGHDHLPNIIMLPDGLVINPGSVGLQAYDDDDPPHYIENGSPHARYCIIRETEDGLVAEHIVLLYDHMTASRKAGQNGRPDWGFWLRTGRVRM